MSGVENLVDEAGFSDTELDSGDGVSVGDGIGFWAPLDVKPYNQTVKTGSVLGFDFSDP